MFRYYAVLETENRFRFGLFLYADYTSQAKSKAKKLSGGCKVKQLRRLGRSYG